MAWLAVVAYSISTVAALGGWTGEFAGQYGPVLAIHCFIAASVWRPWVVFLPLLLILLGLPFNEPDPDGASSYRYYVELFMPFEFILLCVVWLMSRTVELASTSLRWLPAVFLAFGIAAIVLMLATPNQGDDYAFYDRDLWALIAGAMFGAATPLFLGRPSIARSGESGATA